MKLPNLKAYLRGALGAIFTAVVPLTMAQTPTLDTTFNPGSGPNQSFVGYGTVASIAQASNGNIIIGGSFNTFNGVPQQHVVRLDAFGDIDPSFYLGAGPSGPVSAVAVQTNAFILIGGAFTEVNGITQNYLARLRVDGSLDISFTNSPDNSVRSIKPQANGGFLLVGNFSHVNQFARQNLARLNADGSLDSNFNPASRLLNGTVNDAIVQPDGKIVYCGQSSNGATIVQRVDALGNVDSTFNVGFIGGGQISVIGLQADNKLIVAGGISSINGYSRMNLARLNTDGSVDTTFIPPASGSSITSIEIDTNGRIIIACGEIANYARNGIARLNQDGTLDGTFNPTIASGRQVTSQYIQSDGKILIAGNFQSINGIGITNMARLNNDGVNAKQPQFLTIQMYPGMLVGGGISNSYRIEFTTSLHTQSLWTPLTNLTLQSTPFLFIDTSAGAGFGNRYYRSVTLQ